MEIEIKKATQNYYIYEDNNKHYLTIKNSMIYRRMQILDTVSLGIKDNIETFYVLCKKRDTLYKVLIQKQQEKLICDIKYFCHEDMKFWSGRDNYTTNFDTSSKEFDDFDFFALYNYLNNYLYASKEEQIKCEQWQNIGNCTTIERGKYLADYAKSFMYSSEFTSKVIGIRVIPE